VVAVSDLLAHDPDDLVQKAVGGWVREAGKRDRVELLAFLDRNVASMPRTALNSSHHSRPGLMRRSSCSSQPGVRWVRETGWMRRWAVVSGGAVALVAVGVVGFVAAWQPSTPGPVGPGVVVGETDPTAGASNPTSSPPGTPGPTVAPSKEHEDGHEVETVDPAPVRSLDEDDDTHTDDE
jgi:hypothetical protein